MKNKIKLLLLSSLLSISLAKDFNNNEKKINMTTLSGKKKEVEGELTKIICMLVEYIIRNDYVPNAGTLDKATIEGIIEKIAKDEETQKVVIPTIETSLIIENLYENNKTKTKLIQNIQKKNKIINSFTMSLVCGMFAWNKITTDYACNSTLVHVLLYGIVGGTFLLDACSLYTEDYLEDEHNHLLELDHIQKDDRTMVNNFLGKKIIAELQLALENLSK